MKTVIIIPAQRGFVLKALGLKSDAEILCPVVAWALSAFGEGDFKVTPIPAIDADTDWASPDHIWTLIRPDVIDQDGNPWPHLEAWRKHAKAERKKHMADEAA